MIILLIIFNIIQFIVALFFIHIFIISFIPYKKKSIDKSNNHKNSFTILIPVYKELKTALTSVESLISQEYPKENYNICIVADKCDKVNSELFNNELVNLFYINLQRSSKVDSLKYGYNNLSKINDYIVILDVDNLCDKNFLREINYSINGGNRVVQGLRKPRNLDSLFSRLDAFTDYFYSFIDRQKLSELNLSCTLTGSGFAFEKSKFEKYILPMDILGGFDKILQNKLVLDNIKIAYNNDAIVYDEKIASGKGYKTQRTRWLLSYINSLVKFGFIYLKKIFTDFSIDKLNYFFITMRPPLSILGFLLILCILINLIIDNIVLLFFWVFILLRIFIVLIIAMKKNNADKKQYFYLLLTPLILVKHILALFQIKKAKKDFLPTEHS